MSEEWIKVAYVGNCWENKTVYLDSGRERAKILFSKCIHWGYHDDSDWDDHDEVVSIERALKIVYPDEEAIAAILANTPKDYSAVLRQLAEKNK